MTKQAEIDYVKNTGGLERVWLNDKPFRGANPTESARLFRDLAAIVELLNLPEGARVLDVGCGPGWTSASLARMGLFVHGLDLAPDMITLATRRAAREGVADHCVFEVADSESFTLPPEFDAVLVYDTLHHTQDEGAVLRNCYTALKPGGKLLLAEPGALHGARAKDVAEELQVTERGFSPRQLKQTLARVGFSRIRHYVPTSQAFMDGGMSSIKTALFDLGYYFAISETHLQVWLTAFKPAPRVVAR